MSSIEVLPQTPHADVVMKFRRAPGVTATPGASLTSAMFPSSASEWSPCPHVTPSQSLISAISSRDLTTASLTRNPAASSTSSPGVRMVMVSAVPSTRMPSGSSAASRSARASARTATAGPSAVPSCGSVTRSTRRRAVRPATAPPPPRESSQLQGNAEAATPRT